MANRLTANHQFQLTEWLKKGYQDKTLDRKTDEEVAVLARGALGFDITAKNVGSCRLRGLGIKRHERREKAQPAFQPDALPELCARLDRHGDYLTDLAKRTIDTSERVQRIEAMVEKLHTALAG